MTISMIRSNGSRLLSSRRPTTRVSTKISRKTMTARSTRSMAWSSLREGGEGAGHGGQRRGLVVDLDAGVGLPDVGRVGLELKPDLELVALRELVVAEHELAVAARLALRRRLEGVELQAVEESGAEDDPRELDVARRVDGDALLEEQTAAHLRRATNLEVRAAAGHAVGLRALPEHVEQREREEQRE